MITPPTTPSPGRPVSAGFFARLIRWIKSGQLVEGHGYRLHRTPNGTSLVLLSAKANGNAKSQDHGRFAVVRIEKNENAAGGTSEQALWAVQLRNPFYDIGGRTYVMQQKAESSVVDVGAVPDGGIIVLKVSAATNRTDGLSVVGSINELRQLQGDVNFYTFPLYKIEGGNVVCDFRTGPTMSMGEFPE